MRLRTCSRGTVLALALLGLAPTVTPAADGRPNILYIMADDHAAHAVSAYGSKINKTPNIDRLGKEGMRFTRCYVTNSICTPSRAAILTGQYSHKNGVYTLQDPLDPARQQHAGPARGAGRHACRDPVRNPPVHNGRWGKATVEVALAILQSARDGREVVLEHQVAVDGSSG